MFNAKSKSPHCVYNFTNTDLCLLVARSLGKNKFIIFSYTMGQIEFFCILKLKVLYIFVLLIINVYGTEKEPIAVENGFLWVLLNQVLCFNSTWQQSPVQLLPHSSPWAGGENQKSKKGKTHGLR